MALIKSLGRRLKCWRCGWRWLPRKRDVRRCPKCGSALWNKKPGKPQQPGSTWIDH